MVMVIQNLFPVFALLLLGSALKRFRMVGKDFFATSDRLVYFIFFPVLLFWKIGGASQTLSPGAVRFFLSAVCAVGVLYIVSTLFILLAKTPRFQAGAFSQSCYRFNTYIGMAVILTALGKEGAARFGLLIGIAIPFINVLAVSTMIWFSGRSYTPRQRVVATIKALVTNPLILGCVAGLLYNRWIQGFPVFIENTFRLGASVTLPLALLSIGGSLTMKTLRNHWRLALTGSAFKLVALPLVGCWFMRWFVVEEAFFSVGLLFFVLPTSPAIYVLSSQLDSDTEYASAVIVLSTILSFFSLSIVLWSLQV